MKTFILTGINASSIPQKLGKDVVAFVDNGEHFIVKITDANSIQLTTRRGSYVLSKHPILNYYHGECAGHTVQVHLKAITGWLKFW